MFSFGTKQITDTAPFEGFSNRVTDGSDQEPKDAYERWLERLRNNQADIPEGGLKTGQSEDLS